MAKKNETEDLLRELVEVKRQNTNLQAFVDQIRPHFRIWHCDKCGQIKRFQDEVPTQKVKCGLCDLEMRPYAIAQYRELKQQYDELDLRYSTSLAERNKYAKLVQDLIPLLAEYGYTTGEDNLVPFLRTQFEYLKRLESQIANLGDEEDSGTPT